MRMQQPANDRPLRHAFVGVGAGIFASHRLAFSLPTVEVVGVSDVNRAVADERAEELGCPAFSDHRELIASTRPDVVVITTPHPFHAEVAIAAFEAGCHVLTEKPMAVHVGEADAMIDAADKAGRLLAVSFQLRHRPELMAAKRLITEGRLGQIQRVEVLAVWTRGERYYRSSPWRGSWRGEGGAVLLNQAPHNLDGMCYLVGMPSRVVGWARTRLQPIEAEDTAQAMLEWPDGALGTVHVSTAEADLGDRIEIVGTAGQLTIGDGRLDFQVFDTDLRQQIHEGAEMYLQPTPHHAESVELPDSQAVHSAVYRDLHSAILTGSPLRSDGRAARMSLELANAITYSSRRNVAVELPLDRAAYAALLDELRNARGS
jgi:predicted dehydrogenase